MGDPAYVEIVCRKDDAPVFEAIGFMEEFRPGLPSHLLAMVDAEASEGSSSELRTLAEKSIVFRGWHDAGDAYDGACFASAGGKFYDVPRLNHSDLPCIEVHADGTVDADQLVAARQYLLAFDQVGSMFSLPSGTESEEATQQC